MRRKGIVGAIVGAGVTGPVLLVLALVLLCRPVSITVNGVEEPCGPAGIYMLPNDPPRHDSPDWESAYRIWAACRTQGTGQATLSVVAGALGGFLLVAFVIAFMCMSIARWRPTGRLPGSS
jgi:hypothetical protein